MGILKLLTTFLLLLAPITATPTGFACTSTNYTGSRCRVYPKRGFMRCEDYELIKPPPASELMTLTGEIETYISHNHTSSAEVLSYALRLAPNDTDAFTSVPLKLKNDTSVVLITGDNVNVTVKAPSTSIQQIRARSIIDSADLEVEDITFTGRAPAQSRDFVIGGRAVNITSITMVVSDICGQRGLATAASISAQYFRAAAPTPGHVTLENMHSDCSYNKLRFTPDNNLVIGNISIPCSGVYNQARYNSTSKCDTAELYGWMNDALAQVRVRGINLSKYKRRILLLPARRNCPWSGLASVGCTSTCNTWINMSPNSPDVHLPTLFQELGHNIGLMHSNRNVSWTSAEYGDCTDPMGCGGTNPQRPRFSMTCPNAAQQFKAGWARPIDQGALDIVASFAQDGLEYLRQLPATSISDNNFVRIRISDLPKYSQYNQEHALYINYRVRQAEPGFDSGLINELNQRVYVYTYNMTIQSPPRPDPASTQAFKPTIIAALDITAKSATIRILGNLRVARSVRYFYPSVNKGLNITLVRKANTTVTISMCRFDQTNINRETNCTDGLDDDCDGLIDQADPDCRATKTTCPCP